MFAIALRPTDKKGLHERIFGAKRFDSLGIAMSDRLWNNAITRGHLGYCTDEPA